MTANFFGFQPEANAFQYRKRYEVTCDILIDEGMNIRVFVSIPQAV